MKMRWIWILLCMVLLLPCFSAAVVPVEAVTYTDAQWDMLIHKYRDALFGGENVDWADPQIRTIVGVKDSNGISLPGIGERGGRYWLELEKNRQNPGRIFGNRDITIDIPSADMGNQFVFLQYLSKAYATYGTEYAYKEGDGTIKTLSLYGNEALREAIFYGLEKALTFYNYDKWYAQRYSANNTVNYNWWDWGSHVPEQIGNILMALYPYETQAEKNTAQTLANTGIFFVNLIRPNNHSNPTSQMENRRTRMSIMPVLSSVIKDASLMEETKTNLAYFLKDDDTFADGVKEDGSYICHGSYAMEGRYGIDILVARVIDTYSVLSGTVFCPETEDAMNQFHWMMDVFKPLMMDCGIMAQSNGREPQSSLDMGHKVLRGALKLIGCFGPKEDLELMQFIRQIIIGETEQETQDAYAAYARAIGDVNLVNILKTVVFDRDIPADRELYGAMRYMTDRAVQHREGYTVGLAMSSNRIATYESINGRNRYGWFTGDGMVYVYNDTTTYEYDQYGEDYQRFANMYRVPGTTEEAESARTPWSNRLPYYPGMTYTYDTTAKTAVWKANTNSQGKAIGTFVGGVEMDGQFIAAAMDFEAYNWTQAESDAEVRYIRDTGSDELAENNKTKQVMNSDLKAKKAYFMFDDEIVCVGTDIDFTTRSGPIYTYVDNRELLEETNRNGTKTYGTEDILVDGVLLEKVNAFSEPKTYTDPTWVHQENFGGYYFPQGGKVGVNKTFRRSTGDGNSTNDDYNAYYLGLTPGTEQHSFFELWIDHGSKPQDGSYSYVMLPEKTAEETATYSDRPDVSVLCANEQVHVIREHTLGITAMVFWQRGSYGEITVDQPCILMIREESGLYRISACDPTQKLKTLKITVGRQLHAVEADPQIAVTGGSSTVLTLDLSDARGRTLSADFAVLTPRHLMFDFDTENRERYSSSLYGYKDYSNANNWATANLGGKAVTISDGFLSTPLTTLYDNAGKPLPNTNIEPSDAVGHFAWNTADNYANFLRYDPRQAEIFQIRLKLENAVQYGPYTQGVTLYYLPADSSLWSSEADTAQRPNPAREILKMDLPKEAMDGGSLEGKFITMTFDLRKSKFVTYEQIRGIMIVFDSMRQGSVTVDYIYIGPETDHLYFDFNNDAAALRYDRGAYGGFNYDVEEGAAWASTCSDTVASRYTIDNEAGLLSLYAGTDYFDTPGVNEHYGPYLETSAKSGVYPWSDQSCHPLSYDPGNAEILEIRIRTESLVKAPREEPIIILLYCAEKNGISTRYTYGALKFSIEDGDYQTLRMELPREFKDADYIKSLGFRFRGVKAKAEGSAGKIDIDYIYIGPEAHAPSEGVYFDFADTPEAKGRYQAEAYGGFHFGQNVWSWSGLTTPPVIDGKAGTMSVTMKPNVKGYTYVQTSRILQKALPLRYVPRDGEYVQFRFKLENFVPYTTTRMTLYYYTNEESHINGKDTLQWMGARVLSAAEIEGEQYITMTVPVPASMGNEKKITAFRMDLYGCASKSNTELGVITYDYLFVGKKDRLPVPFHRVQWYDREGNILWEQEVLEGEPATYGGKIPSITPDASCHYKFLTWIDEKGEAVDTHSVTGDWKLYPSYEGIPHSFSYSPVSGNRHKVSCSGCSFTAEEAHSFSDGTCLCGREENPEPIETDAVILRHSLNLASDISVNYLIPETSLSNYDMETVYLSCRIPVYEGNALKGEREIKLLPDLRDGICYFVLEGMTAVQMNDKITAVFHGVADGQPYYTGADVYSVGDYAYSQLNKPAVDGALKTLCADLLRYGAKAQIFKSYRTDNLVDGAMTEEHRVYLSDIEGVTFGNTNRVLNDCPDAPIIWAGKSLNLESKVALKFVFRLGSYTGEISDLCLRISYEDIHGVQKTRELTAAEPYGQGTGAYVFTVDSLLAAELRAVVSVQIFADDTPVSPTLQYSADTYGNNKTGALLDLCKALFAYSDSAKAYFGK